MPALDSLVQHRALAETQALLWDGETVFAFLDDVVAAPERVRPIFAALQAALWEHARIQLHAGKTKTWNAARKGGTPNVSDLECDPQDLVWVGDWSLPADQQGFIVLSSPLGHEADVRRRRAGAYHAGLAAPGGPILGSQPENGNRSATHSGKKTSFSS